MALRSHCDCPGVQVRLGHPNINVEHRGGGDAARLSTKAGCGRNPVSSVRWRECQTRSLRAWSSVRTVIALGSGWGQYRTRWPSGLTRRRTNVGKVSGPCFLVSIQLMNPTRSTGWSSSSPWVVGTACDWPFLSSERMMESPIREHHNYRSGNSLSPSMLAPKLVGPVQQALLAALAAIPV